MDSALFAGLIGVIAGSLTTGGLQYAADWRTRRSDSLVAARLVYGALIEVEKTITTGVEHGRFLPNTRFTHQIELWEAQRVALARRLNATEFYIVQTAFTNIRNYDDLLQREQERASDYGLATLRGEPHYQHRLNTISRAQDIAIDAGSTRWDLRRRGEDIKQLENLASGDAVE
jgi:hypothetical protein